MVAARQGRDLFAGRWAWQNPSWEETIASVDWTRVLIEAEGLHMRIAREIPSHHATAHALDGEEVCGDCIKQVLLDKNWSHAL